MADEQPPARGSVTGWAERKADESKRKQGEKEEEPGRGAKRRRGRTHAEQEEKQYREGTVILEITKRDAA